MIDGGAGDDLWMANLSDEIKSVKIDATLSQTAAQGTDAGLNIRRIEQLNVTTGAGNDVVSTLGFALNDSIDMGAGNDSVRTGLGFDATNGQEGTDLLWVDYASLTSDVSKMYVANGWYRYFDADGTASVDFINFERYNLTGGSGNDALEGGSLNDRLTGNAGNDVLNGFRGTDVISGGAGNDTWIADHSDATTALALSMAGGAGTLNGIGTKLTGIENLQLTTGAGNDSVLLADSTGNDYVWTGGGNDTVNVGRGVFEQIDGGLGTDRLTINMSLATSAVRMEYYSNGWWHAISSAGDYEARFINIESFDITGSSKSDRLQGFAGNDTLKGGAGRDVLLGNEGSDTLTGGAGADMFYFDNVSTAGIDTITDAGAGDFLRLGGVTLSGALGTGSGGNAVSGAVEVEIANGTATLHVGVDATAGADFHVVLNGSFVLSGFQVAGNDILIV